jgi:hypothetical protein
MRDLLWLYAILFGTFGLVVGMGVQSRVSDVIWTRRIARVMDDLKAEFGPRLPVRLDPTGSQDRPDVLPAVAGDLDDLGLSSPLPGRLDHGLSERQPSSLGLLSGGA